MASPSALIHHLRCGQDTSNVFTCISMTICLFTHHIWQACFSGTGTHFVPQLFALATLKRH